MKHRILKTVAAVATSAAIFGFAIPAANAATATQNGCTAEAHFPPQPLQNGVIYGWGKGWCDMFMAMTEVTLQVRDPGSTKWRTADGPNADAMGGSKPLSVSAPCEPNASFRVRTWVEGVPTGGTVTAWTGAWSYLSCK